MAVIQVLILLDMVFVYVIALNIILLYLYGFVERMVDCDFERMAIRCDLAGNICVVRNFMRLL